MPAACVETPPPFDSRFSGRPFRRCDSGSLQPSRGVEVYLLNSDFTVPSESFDFFAPKDQNGRATVACCKIIVSFSLATAFGKFSSLTRYENHQDGKHQGLSGQTVNSNIRVIAECRSKLKYTIFDAKHCIHLMKTVEIVSSWRQTNGLSCDCNQQL